ncbi:hypothetical protein ACXR6G_08780 [Ancylomarina sp. YFZ004]
MLTMSYGVPVLISNLEAFDKVIEYKENGFLFKTEYHVDLAREIQ